MKLKNHFVPEKLIESPTGAPEFHASVSAGPDNGANDCHWRAFSNSLRHSTTKAAIDNLIQRLGGYSGPEVYLYLSGHGSPGFLETGAGQNLTQTLENSLWGDFFYFWLPQFQRLSSSVFKMLNIYSCSTGAGEAGADFLFRIAGAINRPVQAYTGTVSCRGRKLIYQPGGQWQVATPTHKPAAISEPKPVKFATVTNKIFLDNSDAEIVQFAMDEIITGNYIDYKKGNEIIELGGDYARELSTIIFNESIQLLPGEIMGMLTKKISFELISGNKPILLLVEVYNDSVAIVRERNLLFYLPDTFKSIFK